MRNSRVIVHLDNFLANINAIKALTGNGPAICLAVKADAYGHGSIRIARAAVDHGVEFLAVASCQEGTELREAGITAPILLLGLPLPHEYRRIVEERISAVVVDSEQIGRFASAAKAAGMRSRLHLKIDTGMGRIGCPEDQATGLATEVAGTDSLVLEGVCTHFPVADQPDSEYTDRQIERFRRCVEKIRASGVSPGLVHAANSAGLERFPDSWFDMVRPGIAAYGYPQGGLRNSPAALKPVMEFRAQVVFLKKVAKGTPLSYGHTYRTRRNTWIATVAVGYADGYRRGLSNRAQVLIHGKRCPVVGTVCMDQILVDVGDHPEVKLYDDVVLFGPDTAGPDAAELAGLADTIPYEIVCGVNPRIPRTFTGGGES